MHSYARIFELASKTPPALVTPCVSPPSSTTTSNSSQPNDRVH